jgi:hypothetical protein
MWAEKKRKRPHEWLEGGLGVLGLAPSSHISQINQKVIKGYTIHFEGTLYLMKNILHLKWGRDNTVEGAANYRREVSQKLPKNSLIQLNRF